MESFVRRRYPKRSIANLAIDAFTFWFSYYAAPIAICLFSVLVVLLPDRAIELGNPAPLWMHVLSDADGRLNALDAFKTLAMQPLQQHYSTHLSEKPVWFMVEAPRGVRSDRSSSSTSIPSMSILLPSKHIRRIACFDDPTSSEIGSVSSAGGAAGSLTHSGSGIAVDAGRRERLVCRAVFSGPAVFSAFLVSPAELKGINDSYHRRAGLLEGGLATLATFVLITAIINRDWVYVLFATWLFGNLRLGAISMGWDDQWFGFAIPDQWVSLIRKITVPVYYILTYALFQALFKADLKRVGHERLLRVVQWLGALLLVASVVLSVPRFLPFMWITVSIGIAVIIFILARLLVVAPSRTVIWYSGALAVALTATFGEVASAVLEKTSVFPTLNSVTAALASSLMAALAIAEQIRAERSERLRAQAALSKAYDFSPVGLFTLAADGRFVRHNPALEAMLGMGRNDMNRHWDDYFPAGSWQTIYRQAVESGAVEIELSRRVGLSNSDRSQPLEGHSIASSGGLTIREDVAAMSATDDDGALHQHLLIKAAYSGAHLEGSVQDITERQQAIQTLSFLAEHDPLTGALNRRGIDTHIADAMAAGDCVLAPIIIAYLDLDRFKLINDLFGHQIGDEVLKQVCRRIETRVPPSGAVCRVGGDEFIILMRNTPLSSATPICEAIVDAIGEEPYQIGTRAFQVHASLGVVEAPAGMPPQEIISAADSACREAKQNGNGRIVVYKNDACMFEEHARDLSLMQRFNGGELPFAGLYLEMQPIMSIRAPYESLDFEVLLRMRGSDGAIIPPSKVISAAEANGSISSVDKWVMEKTLHWIESNRAMLPRTTYVSVNVSGASLNDERFVTEVGQLFRRYRQVVPLICIEITEGVALHDLSNTRRLIDSAQRLGAKVALDDFGAGYTSFPYLRDLPADALKIDGGFVREIHRNPANAAIVEAAIGLARNLGMQSIAEWVEDARTLELLQTMRVDYVQGFAIARPQSPEALLAATSAADFIEDPEILELIGPRPTYESRADRSPESMH
jgi:diguanylate cyclase (GGDEF)-like protein